MNINQLLSWNETITIYISLSHDEGIHPQDSANDFTIELPSELQLKEIGIVDLLKLILNPKN